MAGESVTLTCSVILPNGVIGTPDFQWEGPGVTPTPADPTTSGGMVSSDLILSEISTSQAGLYTCTATLSGSINTSTIIITVQSEFSTSCREIDYYYVSILSHYIVPAPTSFITVNSDNRTAGTTLNLTCDYNQTSLDTSVEIAAVKWMVNGSAATTSQHISITGVSLIFSPLTTSDTGTYTCTLNITTPQTPHITVQEPEQTEKEVITVQSKVHSIPHVIDMISLSLSPSA